MSTFAATYRVTRADLVRYAGASGDFNPIHYSERIATQMGLPGVIAHGMLTMALAARSDAAVTICDRRLANQVGGERGIVHSLETLSESHQFLVGAATRAQGIIDTQHLLVRDRSKLGGAA